MRDHLRSIRRGLGRALRERRLRAHQPYAPILPAPAPPGSPPGPPSPHTSTFDGTRAYEWLVSQCALGPRIPGTGPHREARDLIARELTRYAGEVAFQQWDQRILRGPGAGTTVPLCNIFARFEPSRPEVYAHADRPAAPRLMLCAHWDSRPVADRDPDPRRRSSPVPGANDGASGVAVLLEMARVLRGIELSFPVILAFWDGEDLGEYCYGSRLYARHCRRPEHLPWLPERAILLDMVGKEGLLCARELNSMEQAPALWAEVQRTAARLGLASHFSGPELRIHDDHIHTARAGIESIVLIGCDYPEWHTTGDTVERCSPHSLQVVGSLVEHFLASAAGDPPHAPTSEEPS